MGLAQQHGVTIQWDASEPLPETPLLIHQDYLEHILLSLLVYCILVSAGADDRTVGVRVRCDAVAGGAAALSVRVVAAKRVLSPEQLGVLFDPYKACFHDTQRDAVRRRVAAARLPGGIAHARRVRARRAAARAAWACMWRAA